MLHDFAQRGLASGRRSLVLESLGKTGRSIGEELCLSIVQPLCHHVPAILMKDQFGWSSPVVVLGEFDFRINDSRKEHRLRLWKDRYGLLGAQLRGELSVFQSKHHVGVG